MKKNRLSAFVVLFIYLFISLPANSNTEIKKIINGNERISNETILMFSKIDDFKEINNESLNIILKNLYDTNFFKDVSVSYENNNLIINVEEQPIIQEIIIKGIKANKIKEPLLKGLKLRERSSYNEISIKYDQNQMLSALKELGYYFATLDIYVEDLEDNKVNITYEFDLGNKAKIQKITFLGNKVFKDNKLKGIITSEEYKFWKFISGKKYLNENLISFDENLLRNFYLNKGYFNVRINSSFAKVQENESFELVYNIDAKEKLYFGDLSLNLPQDFNKNNFESLNNLLSELKNEVYSLNTVQKILDEIDQIIINEEFQSINATVTESFDGNKINLIFDIQETETFYVEKINIFGNNVTRENVLRNQLEIDEGDPFNEILHKKSVNNIKSLRFFKKVKDEILDGSKNNSKIINLTVEESPTGEISAGAGVGTNGTTIAFGIKENNYLGKGHSIDSNISLSEESIKGKFGYTNPNYANTDKLLFANIQVIETDRLENFGYKTGKSGFETGVEFEFLKDLNIGLSTSSYFEKVETTSKASASKKKQAGNFWDTFTRLVLDYDKRNQKFQTSDGFRSTYYLDMPIISETNTLTNTYRYKYFTELFENNVSTLNLFLQSANSITDDDIKLSERLFVPARNLRGFESGKVGPKDGSDFVGGNYVTTLNFSTTLPQILPSAQNIDFVLFLDAANIWGVDYDNSLDDGGTIRSAAGIGIDWLTAIGPLTFSLAETITKSSTDITESFRFNIGTTF